MLVQAPPIKHPCERASRLLQAPRAQRKSKAAASPTGTGHGLRPGGPPLTRQDCGPAGGGGPAAGADGGVGRCGLSRARLYLCVCVCVFVCVCVVCGRSGRHYTAPTPLSLSLTTCSPIHPALSNARTHARMHARTHTHTPSWRGPRS
jgi:hypothetical protein